MKGPTGERSPGVAQSSEQRRAANASAILVRGLMTFGTARRLAQRSGSVRGMASTQGGVTMWGCIRKLRRSLGHAALMRSTCDKMR